MAIDRALSLVEKTGDRPVPLHIRNAPTSLMKELGYGENYKYAHDYPGNFVRQQYLPDGLEGSRFWTPGANPQEERARALQEARWGKREK